ncbi:hypothetical protein NDU88_007645 [Pleurodeles waltl]|uniref:Uncharacterized protein n=1 Tax=Pleurodeles waltl TaxID=8319 RepID=A0AAV7VT17_PLEWA|nr:hypothetical protein NDU88_007645 [Pleurodeles waltl]
MTYDAEGVINIRREDGRERSGKKKEEPRTRGSRSEEIAIGASEEERETAVTGEPTTERETAITRGPEEEKDTVEAGEWPPKLGGQSMCFYVEQLNRQDMGKWVEEACVSRLTSLDRRCQID